MKGDRNVYVTVGFSLVFPDSTDGDAEVQAEYFIDQIKHLIESYKEFQKLEESDISVEEVNDDEDNAYEEEENYDPYANVYGLPGQRKRNQSRTPNIG